MANSRSNKVEKIKLKTIAEMVGVSEKCVRTTLNNFRETRSGRPQVTTDCEKSYISRTEIVTK